MPQIKQIATAGDVVYGLDDSGTLYVLVSFDYEFHDKEDGKYRLVSLKRWNLAVSTDDPFFDEYEDTEGNIESKHPCDAGYEYQEPVLTQPTE